MRRIERCQLNRRRFFIAPRPRSPRPIKPRVEGSGAGVAGISRSAYCGKLKLWTQPTRSASMSRLPPDMVRAIEPLLFIHPLGKMLPPPCSSTLKGGTVTPWKATDQNKLPKPTPRRHSAGVLSAIPPPPRHRTETKKAEADERQGCRFRHRRYNRLACDVHVIHPEGFVGEVPFKAERKIGVAARWQ